MRQQTVRMLLIQQKNEALKGGSHNTEGSNVDNKKQEEKINIQKEGVT